MPVAIGIFSSKRLFTALESGISCPHLLCLVIQSRTYKMRHHVFGIVFLAFAFSVDCQYSQPLKRIAFSKYKDPPSWERFDKNKVLPTFSIVHTSFQISFPYRAYIHRQKGFSYIADLKPGFYNVQFGLLEKSPCRIGARVFRFSVGNSHTRNIDVFKEVGCLKPLDIFLQVYVPPGSPLVLRAEPVSGKQGPLLNNLQIYSSTRSDGREGNGGVGNTKQTDQNLPTMAKVMFARNAKSLRKGYSLFSRANLKPGNAKLEMSNSRRIIYRDHIYSRRSLTYTQPMQDGLYTVRLGFLEPPGSTCNVGKRVFSAKVGDKSIPSVDVYKAVGCQKPYDLVLNNVKVANNKLVIKLVRKNGKGPFISHFESKQSLISTPSVSSKPGSPIPAAPEREADTSSSPTPTSSATSNRDEVDITINAGPEGAVKGTTKTFYGGPISGALAGIPAKVFKTALYGKDFTYTFDLAPGAYDVTLGFMETYRKNCEKLGSRVFSVYVNDILQLEGFDMYAEVGCYKVKIVMLNDVTVGAVDTKPLTIRFLAVSNFAQIAYIRIKSGQDVCVPASSTGSLSDDHAAHAVPGSYPPQNNINSPLSYVDNDGDGYYVVKIDGKDSHTHFFDADKGIIGRITDYTWTIAETGRVISKQAVFTYRFPLGTTRLKLTVKDNSCTTDESETTVTVTGKLQPGQYCYYYQGLTSTPLGGTLLENPRPVFSAISPSLDLSFPKLPFANEKFVVRCQFFLDTVGNAKLVTLAANTAGSGYAKVYKGEDIILDTTTFPSTKTIMATGLTAFEVIYSRFDTLQKPHLVFSIEGKVPGNHLVKYDQSTVLPIITAITPNQGKASGGTTIRIAGHGLFSPMKVSFGSSSVNVQSTGISEKHISVRSPPAIGAGSTEIYVESSTGMKSNTIQFTYGETTCDEPGFVTKQMFTEIGGKRQEVDFLKLPTCATLGPDKRIYMGTLGGTVQVLGYDPFTLKATTHCYSNAVVDQRFKQKDGNPSKRDILGIAFNPQETQILPYVSTSTLYWLKQERIDPSNRGAWRNGAIDRMKVVEDPGKFIIGQKTGVCLTYDRRVVSNLPVSNLDHSVNGILFTQEGDLLIAVGGNTNMGLPGYKLGGMWETHLSGSILIAKLSRGMSAFNGNIRYSDENTLYLAKKISGDVDLYATGMRNTFGITMTRNGEVYAADQGPNCLFGNWATACNDFDEAKAATWSPTAEVVWPSQFISQTETCKVGAGRNDKILYIVKGKFYGHPNIQRGVTGECAWIDPFTDKTADQKAPPSNYLPAIRLLPSSVTGLGEYGSSHFCGKLRGDLILSSYRGRRTWRMKVSGGKLLNGPSIVSRTGGIQFVEDMHGNLIFPRLTEKIVTVFTPKVTVPSTLTIVGVWPWRHRREGGSKIYIGGYNFADDARVYINGVSCPLIQDGRSDREITCVVPRKSGTRHLVDIKIIQTGEETQLPNAILYTTQ